MIFCGFGPPKTQKKLQTVPSFFKVPVYTILGTSVAFVRGTKHDVKREAIKVMQFAQVEAVTGSTGLFKI